MNVSSTKITFWNIISKRGIIIVVNSLVGIGSILGVIVGVFELGTIIVISSLIGISLVLGIIGGIFALKYTPRILPNQKERIIKASKFIIGFFSLALIGTMMQHLMGNILFENILAQPIGYIERTAYPGIWASIFFVYPVERFALVILAVIIGAPVVRVLKTTFFNDSKKSAKQGSESRVQP